LARKKDRYTGLAIHAMLREYVLAHRAAANSPVPSSPKPMKPGVTR
jgi:hypothetical protein